MNRQTTPDRTPQSEPYLLAKAAAQQIRELTGHADHQIGVILGTGWAPAIAHIGPAEHEIAATELPGFLPASAPGHASTIQSITPSTSGKRVLVFAGRTHLYENHGPGQAVHAVRTAVSAGCTSIVLTNGAGGIRPDYRPGQLVLISDHINLTATSPLTGPRFTDLTDVYSPRLRAICQQINPDLAEGVYLQLPGPHYETPAEIRMARLLGADLVGMSTAIEAIAARDLGAEVLGISLITNPAAGLTGAPISASQLHETETTALTAVSSLVREILTSVLTAPPPQRLEALAR
jgi:purine-nucleoside phosphorylase